MTTVQDEQTATAFSEAIRTASWAVHEHAEAQPFMQDLLSGRLPLDAYTALLAQQHLVYRELERIAVRMAADPVAGPFVRPELFRLPSLEADLAALAGASWSEQLVPIAATAAYLDRLRGAAASWSGAFVAHHYVRYMGDLSGGQVIRRVLERTFGIEDHAGTSFYVFDGVDDLRSCKEGYRARLDAAPWTAEERERIVAEVLVAYDLNAAVIDELGRTVGT